MSAAASGSGLFRPEAVRAASARPFGQPVALMPRSWWALTGFFLAFASVAVAFLATATFPRKETAVGVLRNSLGELRVTPPRAGVVRSVAGGLRRDAVRRTRVGMGESGMTPLASESRPGRFGRAVERFNRRALRFTRPGPRWFTASVKLGLIMKAAAILVGVAVEAARSAFGRATPPSPFVAGRGVLEWVLLGMVLAPLFETALIWLVHALTRRWLGLTGFVLVNTVLAYANHVPTTGVPIAAALVFTAMSYQYVSFRDDVGAGQAFAGVAVSHAVCNSIPTLIVAAESILGGPIV